jgi:PAS domain S-box-containing protein
MSEPSTSKPLLDELRAERLAALNLIEDAIAARQKAERAEAILRSVAELDAFRVRLTDALSGVARPEAVKSTAVDILGKALDVERVYYAEVEPNDEYLVVPQDYYTDGSQPGIAGRFRIKDYGLSVFGDLRANLPAVVPDTGQLAQGSPAESAAYAAIQTRAFIAVPLLKDGRLVAVLGLTQSTPRNWTGEEVAQARETAERTWAAVERARAEETIRANEEQFRRAIQDAPIPIIMHAEDGQVLQVSRTWAERTGYSLEDIPTFEAWLNKAHGPGADEVRAHVQKLFRGRARLLNAEIDVTTRGGDRRRWAFSASAPGTLRDGRRYIVEMAVDVTDRAEELRAANTELRGLSKRLVEAQETERRRVAETLHDDIGQVLTGLNLVLKRARRKSSLQEITEAELLVADLLARVRNLSTKLRPHVLDNLGLAVALRWHVKNFIEQTKIRVALQLRGITRDVPADAATTVYRIVQEALTNVARHSGAKRAGVVVSKDKGVLEIEVRDNGRGFDPENVPRESSGVATLRERVRASGGEFLVSSSRKSGTTLRATLPLAQAPAPPPAKRKTSTA